MLGSVGLMDDSAADDRSLDPRLVNLLDRYLEDVAVNDDEVGELAFLDRAELVGPIETEALDAASRVTPNSLLQRNGLISI